ncbi:hypothetical protein [Bradyrhizobium elkanii]|uniref:hypothetical protein n=1 Tax=Bradyrhizobium elkanii TaxID=29448 RepID=UPI0004BCAD3F|nr:hypothetical protein [Bradyrhizobium elkanii]
MNQIGPFKPESLVQVEAPIDLAGGEPEFLPSKRDPVAWAAEVAEGMLSGAASVIAACVKLTEAERNFAGDPDLTSRFIDALVRKNVIPRRSTRLGEFDRSKLAMLRKIGEQSSLLLQTEISRYLQPGYSVLYHILRLYEELPGDHEKRLRRLVEIFAAEGHLSREFLIAEIKKAQRTSKAQEAGEVHLPLPKGATYDLVLLDLSNRQYGPRWSQDHVDRMPLYARVHESVSDNAVAICVARLNDLPVVGNKLLPGCGFGMISRVLLVKEPADTDVTDAELLIIAMRGEPDRVRFADFEWFSPDEPLDPVALAAGLVPDAVNRLHLFASMETAGWHSVVGDANWSYADE